MTSALSQARGGDRHPAHSRASRRAGEHQARLASCPDGGGTVASRSPLFPCPLGAVLYPARQRGQSELEDGDDGTVGGVLGRIPGRLRLVPHPCRARPLAVASRRPAGLNATPKGMCHACAVGQGAQVLAGGRVPHPRRTDCPFLYERCPHGHCPASWVRRKTPYHFVSGGVGSPLIWVRTQVRGG